MRKTSTLFLRGVVCILALAVLAFCGYVIPSVWSEAGGYQPILLGMCVSAVPFFAALWQTLKLLGYIDAGTAFSELSVRALRNIRYCAIVIGALYFAGMPYIYIVAERDDAPGVILIGLVIVGGSVVIGIFSAVLQKLLQNAIDIKKENELVV